MARLARRRFLAASAATLTAPLIIPAASLGAAAPSNKITVGFIGTGSHGVGRNLKMYLQQSDARVLAVCDVDAGRMRDAKQLVDRNSTATPTARRLATFARFSTATTSTR